MAKFEKVGNGFVKYGDSLMNLKSYKEISNVGVEWEEGTASGIKFTPLQTSKENIENNFDGSFYVSYSAGEEAELEEDFAIIKAALID
jgi:hypothetical protein